MSFDFRKLVRLGIGFAICLGCTTQVIAGAIKVKIAGSTEKISSYSENNITYISFSGLADLLGGVLDWEILGHTVSYLDETSRFEFLLGSPYFKLNDTTQNMIYAAEFSDGQLFLPAKTFIPFLDRVLPQKIVYYRKSNSITISSDYFNVTDLSVSHKANGLLIEIHLTSALAYEVYITEGNWVNVSIRDGIVNSRQIRSRIDRRSMYRLKTHQAAESGQVSFRLRKNVKKWHHTLVNDPPRIQISFTDVDFAFDTTEGTPIIGPDSRIDVIVVDPGHGGSDYGAIGPGGTREKDIALDIAHELAKLIRKDKQFKVIMTRDRDKTLTLQQRANIANQAKADLFISIHANSSLKQRARGWNVFFLAPALNDSARAVAQLENSTFLREQSPLGTHREQSYDDQLNDPILGILNEMLMTEFQEESHDFSMMIDREFRRKLKIPARGVDQAGFYVLNMIFMPSVLIETGFISNKQEERVLKSKKHRKAVAGSIYNAIKRFKAKYENL